MKKLSLFLAALMITGVSFACDGKKEAKACCKKGEKKEACCKKGDKNCNHSEAKKEDKKTDEKKS
ncbi:MAG: hypothetical protein JSS78_01610 [Bacteroidetes bacterium]|nr:hypothetical protein [Bacteroidota bacterium]MBS1740375.1 hypothetical protein [Bacteroidota bacterium]MBS1775230.1 hypothetical protein [Bacteroidota bacterium]MBS1781740.1 hypothetical protein [Bacteroidota bacterium]